MATTAEAQVCNLALGLVGQRQTIDSLDEQTEEARACKLFFPHVRTLLFEAFDWSFATSRAVLALTTEARNGWAYCYQEPTGCLAPSYLWAGEVNPPPERRIPFERELRDAADGHLILTDLAQAELVFVRAVSVALWPASFVDAVAGELAVRLALTLPVKPELAGGLQGKASRALQWAISKDLMKRQASREPEGSAVRARS